MTVQMTRQRAYKSSHKRGGNYKIVFKPLVYTKSLTHWNSNWEEGPLLPWKHNTHKRCLYLVNHKDGNLHKKIAWAAIYKMNDEPGDLPVAVYTQANEWNNDVTKKYKEQNLPVYEGA